MFKTLTTRGIQPRGGGLNTPKILNFSGILNAFTLSEVLITLGIIGIIAALTLPGIIAKHQKVTTVNKLKKVYSVFSQALLSSQNDNGSPADWVNDGEEIKKETAQKYFETYWKPYIKTARICAQGSYCGYKTATAWRQPNGNAFDTGIVDENTRTSFFMPDGTFVLLIYFSWDTTDGTPVAKFSKKQRLYIDVNGNQNPNMLGKDVFYFVIDLENAALKHPETYKNQTKEMLIQNCQTYGTHCSTLIMQASWQIDKDYPLY